jgi:polyhydroxybutyrate depolymerase
MRTHHQLCLTLLSLVFGWLLVTPLDAQQLFTRTIDVDGLDRQYLIYLPVDFDRAENLPVMAWHHGGGGSASEALNYEADFRSLANSRRFILVYPNAHPDVLEGCTCWGYEEPGGYSNGNYEIDLAFTSAMIDDLVATYNADRTRIYAGGYSMGGSYVWDLACAKSDEIAAVAPVAASVYPWTFEACDAALPIGICHILGTDDFYAPYDGGWVPSAAAQHAYWVAKNQAVTPPETESLGGGVTRYTWVAGEGCHAVEHFRRQGGGHDVPSFATTVIWDFVSQHALDGVFECSDDSIAGDFNGDGIVDGVDLSQLLGYWNTANPLYDIDANGLVDGADLTIVLANWSI